MKKSELRQIIQEEIAKFPTPTQTTPTDVKRLEKTIGTSTIKAVSLAINDRNELKKAIPSITKSWGPMLQPNKITLSSMLADIKAGLVAAGYK